MNGPQDPLIHHVDLRVGLVLAAEAFAPDPLSMRLWIDFGPSGVKKTVAPIAELYDRDDMVGRLVVADISAPLEAIHDFPRQARVLTVHDRSGRASLIEPDYDIEPGERIL